MDFVWLLWQAVINAEADNRLMGIVKADDLRTVLRDVSATISLSGRCCTALRLVLPYSFAAVSESPCKPPLNCTAVLSFQTYGAMSEYLVCSDVHLRVNLTPSDVIPPLPVQEHSLWCQFQLCVWRQVLSPFQAASLMLQVRNTGSLPCSLSCAT